MEPSRLYIDMATPASGKNPYTVSAASRHSSDLLAKVRGGRGTCGHHTSAGTGWPRWQV